MAEMVRGRERPSVSGASRVALAAGAAALGHLSSAEGSLRVGDTTVDRQIRRFRGGG